MVLQWAPLVIDLPFMPWHLDSEAWLIIAVTTVLLLGYILGGCLWIQRKFGYFVPANAELSSEIAGVAARMGMSPPAVFTYESPIANALSAPCRGSQVRTPLGEPQRESGSGRFRALDTRVSFLPAYAPCVGDWVDVDHHRDDMVRSTQGKAGARSENGDACGPSGHRVFAGGTNHIRECALQDARIESRPRRDAREWIAARTPLRSYACRRSHARFSTPRASERGTALGQRFRDSGVGGIRIFDENEPLSF